MGAGAAGGVRPEEAEMTAKIAPDENYPTPAALAVEGWRLAARFLERPARTARPFGAPSVECDPGFAVCEPGCGDGQPFLLAAAADPRVIRLDGYDVRAVTPAPGLGAEVPGQQPLEIGTFFPPSETPRIRVLGEADWLSVVPGLGTWDAIVTNPPFSVAEEFLRASLCRLAPGGVVVFLARGTWLGGSCRRGFWGDCPPVHVECIRPRPRFIGRNDTNDYFWIVWQPSSTAAPTFGWCDWTPEKKKGRGRCRST